MPEIWVLELSSFQLVYASTFNATAATVLNITQDHLDWHGDMQAYVDAKAKIFGQDSICILNRDDALVMNLLTDEQKSSKSVITFGAGRPDEQGAFGIEHDLRAGGIDWLVWAEMDEDLEPQPKRRRKAVVVEDEPLRLKRLIPAEALRIRGRHNALNALAALALARSAGLPMNMLLHGLRDYHGEPHRVQSVSIVSNVEYVDDSKGTNVGATVAALNGLSANESGKRKTIAEALGDSVPCVMSETLQNAVVQAAKQAQSGDIVLLSPACASFDQFSDYVARAEVFIAEVQELGMQFEGVDA
jgi:UDP-N-acetylmuramoylalanine--D-glutamate ligase